MKNSKNLKSVIELLRAMTDSGMLDPAQTKAIVRAMKSLNHALQVRDLWQVESAINDIARIIVRVR